MSTRALIILGLLLAIPVFFMPCLKEIQAQSSPLLEGQRPLAVPQAPEPGPPPEKPQPKAQQKSGQPKKAHAYTPEEEAMAMFIGLAAHDYIKYGFVETGMLVEVEPLFWGKAMHRDKVDLVAASLKIARLVNERKGAKISTVIFLDMTSHEELAHGFLSGVSPGKIEIIK